MWRIGGGCGPNWTSAGKRGASSDASVVTPPNSSANLRNAVSTQVCHPRKKVPELTLDRTVRLLEEPELRLPRATALVDYHIDRNKVAKESHEKTWKKKHRGVKYLRL